MSSNTRGALFGLLAFAAFASHDAVIKALGGSYAPFQIVFFSVLFGFPLVTVSMMRDGQPGTLIPKHPWWLALRSLMAVVGATGAFYAFSHLPLAQVYAILFATPLMITVIAIPMLGERVGLHRGAAVLAGLIGVLIVLRPGGTEFTLAHLAAVVSAFGAALTSLIVRRIGREERPVVMILYPMMANFLIMGALLPFFYRPMPGVDLAGMALIAALALVGTSGLVFAYRHAPAALVAPMQYSQIIWAVLFGVLFFEETPDVMTGVGTAVIVASGLYILFRETRGGQSANTPVLRTRSRFAAPSAPRVAPFLPENQRGAPGERDADQDRDPAP